MSAQQHATEYMTLEAYFALEEANPEGRYEYIDGYVRDLRLLLMAGGTPRHAEISANIMAELKNALRGGPCHVYSSDVKLILAASRYLYPDVSVSCEAQDAEAQDGIRAPRLVVEVLSPATQAYDHIQKLHIYSACPSIHDYLLVDATRRFAEGYQRNEQGKIEYMTYTETDVVTLNGLRIAIAIARLYDNIRFAEDQPATN